MGAWRSKLSVPRTFPPLSESRPPPTASVLAQETSDGARGSSGVLARIPPSEPLRKRLRSAVPEDGGDAKRMKDLDNGGVPDTALGCGDGHYQLASASASSRPESLLFSCQPSGAASDMVLGPSGSAQPMSLFKLDGAKHKIFLSHSGAQKDFVEQLCVDLERKGYFFPFFDQRHHSLPKGEDFAPLIIEAARLCQVAVIVLSKEFLSSKWPMIELAEFYATQQGTRGGGGKLKLLPLFFKLSIEEVKDEGHWMPIWKEHVACDDRIDLSIWSAAVKSLCKSNGLAFGKVARTEVSYRKCVVESIFKLSPPDLLFGSSINMVGYGRMCEAMSRQFVEDSTTGVRVLGIHGMAGLGKTMLAKALHDYFYGEFMGRVCCVDMTHGSRAKRQKLMLKMLSGFDKDMVDCVGANVEKGLRLMESFVMREPVFLVLDNVISNVHLLKEVRDYLKMGFHRESRIMITSSSQAILEDLLPNMELYTPMPTLRVEEAKALFLNHAAPRKAICELTKQEQDILGICIQKCWFDSEEGGFYHPVALIALADFFCRFGRSKGNPLLVWKDHLEKEMDLVKDVMRSSKDLFGILGLQFSTFDFNEKLLFLDIALFYSIIGSMHFIDVYDVIGRLCRLHDESRTTIEGRLMNLRNSGMINFDPSRRVNFKMEYDIKVPSLYVEFAKWYAMDHKVNGLKNAWGVFELGGMGSRVDSSTPARCWSNLIRLCIVDVSLGTARFVACKRMQSLSKLVVLQLYNCLDLTTLSLEGFDCLREVVLVNFPELVTLTLSGNSSEDDYVGIYHSLQDMVLFDLPSLVHMPDLSPCTSLHTICVLQCHTVINLEGVDCPCLKELVLYHLHSINFEKLLAFKCLQSLVGLLISAGSDDDYFEGHWQDRDIALECEVTLEGEGRCAKFLKELCLLLDDSKNMICTDFYSN